MAEKEPHSTTEPAPKESFETTLLNNLLDDLEEGFKAIVKGPKKAFRDQRALSVLRDIVITTAAALVKDNPDEPELPENKFVELPFGEFYIVVNKQSHADFLNRYFGARECLPPLENNQNLPLSMGSLDNKEIESYERIYTDKSGKDYTVRMYLDEKGNIIHSQVIEDED